MQTAKDVLKAIKDNDVNMSTSVSPTRAASGSM